MNGSQPHTSISPPGRKYRREKNLMVLIRDIASLKRREDLWAMREKNTTIFFFLAIPTECTTEMFSKVNNAAVANVERASSVTRDVTQGKAKQRTSLITVARKYFRENESHEINVSLLSFCYQRCFSEDCTLHFINIKARTWLPSWKLIRGNYARLLYI